MVKVKDMYLTWASDQTVCKAGECGGAVTTLLKYALESKMVDGVLAVTKGADLYDGVPTLFTKPEDVIKSAGSLHCAPVQLGKVLVQYLSGAKDMKIAVPVKAVRCAFHPGRGQEGQGQPGQRHHDRVELRRHGQADRGP